MVGFGIVLLARKPQSAIVVVAAVNLRPQTAILSASRILDQKG